MFLNNTLIRILIDRNIWIQISTLIISKNMSLLYIQLDLFYEMSNNGTYSKFLFQKLNKIPWTKACFLDAGGLQTVRNFCQIQPRSWIFYSWPDDEGLSKFFQLFMQDKAMTSTFHWYLFRQTIDI